MGSTFPLSEETRGRIARLFAPDERVRVEALLVERCNTNLPGTHDWPEWGIERIQFAALKASGGTLSGMAEAVRLANVDWRDLLVAAGFAHDPSAHKSWFP